VGVDYSKGVLDHVRYINEVEGGIRGKVKIDLVWSDYAYRIPDAVSLYRKYRDIDRVNAIVGWGTGDTEALKDTISEDQIPYISASYSSHLDDPAKTPYNFYPVSSYSDQLRAVLKFAKELAVEQRIAKPKFVFMYPDHPYGRAPIAAGIAYAQELGFEIGPVQIVALAALEARSQVAAVKSFFGFLAAEGMVEELPGQVEPLQGRELFQAQQWVAKVDTRFTIRRPPIGTMVTPDEKTRLVYDGRSYDVKHVAELGRHEGLEILAQARAE